MRRILSRRVAFVIGAGSVIGRATALAREGASVVVAEVSEESNQETSRLIEEIGRRSFVNKQKSNYKQ